MSGEKRKTPRRPVEIVAHLYTDDGWPLGECTMRDVSASGAQLAFASDKELPDTFLLSLSRDAKVRRQCKVVWRRGKKIGVQFRTDQSSVQETCRVLTDMMSAAARDGPIDKPAVEAGARIVVETIAESGIQEWLDIVWTYDDVTYQHCLLVAGLAAAFAVHLNFSTNDRRLLTRAALVHDVGKAKIPVSILNKPDKLSRDEMTIMRTHPKVGYDTLCRQGGWDAETLDAVLHHHEYLDGSGYPDGLVASQINDLVRLVTICDIYAALVERRPYRSPLSSEEGFRILRSMSDELEGVLVESFGEVISMVS